MEGPNSFLQDRKMVAETLAIMSMLWAERDSHIWAPALLFMECNNAITFPATSPEDIELNNINHT